MYGIKDPERLETLRLSDGRTLAGKEWGPKSGLPVLFCTGSGMSGWLGFGGDDVDELGVRLMAVDRPGLGSSNPHPEKTLESWVSDLRELLEVHQFQNIAAVGFSQGAPFTLALAAKNLVNAVAIVSGLDDLAHSQFKGKLHPDVVNMVAEARANPKAFEEKFASFATADGMWKLIMDVSSARDKAVYAEPMFGAAFQRSLQEGFSQGAGGYARDLVNGYLPWPFELENIQVPVDLWYGALDTSPVHSPDFGATLETRLPKVARVLLQDEGGSLLWTRSREILSKLVARDE